MLQKMTAHLCDLRYSDQPALAMTFRVGQKGPQQKTVIRNLEVDLRATDEEISRQLAPHLGNIGSNEHVNGTHFTLYWDSPLLKVKFNSCNVLDFSSLD